MYSRPLWWSLLWVLHESMILAVRLCQLSLKAMENLQSDWHLTPGGVIGANGTVSYGTACYFPSPTFPLMSFSSTKFQEKLLRLPLCYDYLFVFEAGSHVAQVDPDLILNQGCVWIGNPLAADSYTLREQVYATKPCYSR